jgi:hypothetical protein
MGTNLMLIADLAAPRTEALRRTLSGVRDAAVAADLRFLEAWEEMPAPGPAHALRIMQIRRANPELAAEIRAELAARRS